MLVLDTSASMAATDITPDRLTAAKSAALGALRDLPTGGKVSVIAADRSARIVVNETTDLGRVRQALAGVETTSAHGDLGDALELAGKLAARSGDAQVLVATDGALATPATTTVPAKITVLPVGRERKNQAIVAMPSGRLHRRSPGPSSSAWRTSTWNGPVGGSRSGATGR